MEVESLELKISSQSREAASGIDELTDSLSRLSAESAGYIKNLKGISEAISGMKAPIAMFAGTEAALSGVMPYVEGLSSSLDDLRIASERLIDATEKLTPNVKDVGDKVKATNSQLSKFLGQIKRIAVYRAIRTALKGITSAVKEGFQNLILFDKAYENATWNIWQYNQTASLLASTFMIMKNNIGVLAGNLMQILAPALITVMNLMSRLISTINGVIAAFRGQGSYLIANPDYWTDYAAGIDKSTGSAKKLKNVLFGFDELNILPSANAGGAAAGQNIADMFIQKDVADSQLGWAQAIGEQFQKIKGFIESNFGSIDRFKDKLWEIFAVVSGVWVAIKGIGIAIGIKKFIDDSLGGLSTAIGFIINHPIAALIVAIGAIVTAFVIAYNTSETFRNKVNGVFESVKKFGENVVQKFMDIGDSIAEFVNKIIYGFQRLVNDAIGIVNKLIDAYNKIAPVLGKQPLGKIAGVTFEKIPTNKGQRIYDLGNKGALDEKFKKKNYAFASGGIPDYGSLFLAGEKGAELVGNVGGRTNVINEEQLTMSLAQANNGVISAIMQAAAIVVEAASESKPIELDGMRVTRSLQKSQSRLDHYNSPALVNGATF